MATLHVRNCPDELHRSLQSIASEEQRSLGAEVIVLLEGAVGNRALRRQRMELLEQIGHRRRSFRQPEGAADSLDLLREDRAR